MNADSETDAPERPHVPPPSMLSLRAHANTMRPTRDPAGGAARGVRPAYLAAGLATVLGVGAGFLLFGGADASRAHTQVVYGKAEPRLSVSGAAQRWHDEEVTITIDASVRRLGDGAAGAVRSAFATWVTGDSELPDLVFDSRSKGKLSANQDGVNAVLVAPIDVTGHESDLAITISYSDAETGRISESDIVINARHTYGVLEQVHEDDRGASVWHGSRDDDDKAGEGAKGPVVRSSCGPEARAGKACGGRFDLQNVLTHEVGHFLGLSEDGADTTATMFRCTSACETHKRDLARADVQSVDALYGGALDENAAVGCGGAAVAARAPGRGASDAFLWAIAAGLVLRRRPRARRARRRVASEPSHASRRASGVAIHCCCCCSC